MWITSDWRLALGVSLRRPSGGGDIEADLAYFRRRLAQEKAAAEAAGHPKVRQAHLDLAAGYDVRLAEAAALERRDTMHVVSAA